MRITDPKGLATHYKRDGLGGLIEQRSPDTGITAQHTDVAGNVVSVTDARGQTRRMRYDVLQRLVEMSFDGAPTETIRYAYDQADAACPAGETHAIGRLSWIADASGGTIYCYNALGQLTRKRQSTGGTVLELAYSYTPAGRLNSVRYPDGHTAVYARDANGRITNVDIANANGIRQSLIQEASYLPFGAFAQWRYGHSRTLSRRYDINGRAISVRDDAPGGLSATFGYDANGRLISLSTSSSGTPQLAFAYDALGRLTETRDAHSGTVLERYRYDLTGNRTAFIDAKGAQLYTYPNDSHRLIAVAGQSRNYDAMGKLIADDGRNRQFSYNAMGRMAEVREGVSVLRRYAYNAKGEQVLRSDGGDAGATLTIYDEGGRWPGNYDRMGHVKQQVVWLDDHPVGLIQDGKLYYVESDHLGTPRVVIDPVRDVAVWRWDLKGEVFGSTAPDQDPDRDGLEFRLDTRFPGQRYDRIAELNYNHQRDYDFLAGRYAQSDPIGLASGVSTYGYVSGNPNQNIDPLGLGTIAIGGQASGQITATFSISAQFSLSWNSTALTDLSQWRIGGILSIVPLTVASSGVGASAGGLFTYSPTNNVSTLNGWGPTHGISGGEALVLGYDMGNPYDPCNRTHNIFIGAGLELTGPIPGELHSGVAWTAAGSFPLWQ